MGEYVHTNRYVPGLSATCCESVSAASMSRALARPGLIPPQRTQIKATLTCLSPRSSRR